MKLFLKGYRFRYKNNKLYNELEPGKYHEYRYDTCKEELIYTNLVEYI